MHQDLDRRNINQINPSKQHGCFQVKETLQKQLLPMKLAVIGILQYACTWTT